MARSRIDDFRAHKDEYFRDGANSPLELDDLETFEGLDYFDENPDLAFRLELNREVPGANEIVELATSDGLTMEFSRAGTITFDVGGEAVTLTVFRDLDRGRYFLPFKDATTGVETYEEGRYLDPQMDPDGYLIVDFNYAYNPYCAYSEGWSCPLPPEENHLKVRIEAGEKDYRPGGNRQPEEAD